MSDFGRWLMMGEEGSVQRERYNRAVEAWNAGASEEKVAEIIGLPPGYRSSPNLIKAEPPCAICGRGRSECPTL